jgi:hypothetical protein
MAGGRRAVYTGGERAEVPGEEAGGERNRQREKRAKDSEVLL